MLTLSVGDHRHAAGAPARALAPEHRPGSGIILGLQMATVSWLWLALMDAALGHPFRTFAFLGGIAAFTAGHFLLNAVFGVAVMSFVRGAARAPSLVIGLIFVFIIFEVAFGMLVIMISEHTGGATALLLAAGNAISCAAALVVLERRYHLRDTLHRAEAES
jgi:hypothetical protein